MKESLSAPPGVRSSPVSIGRRTYSNPNHPAGDASMSTPRFEPHCIGSVPSFGHLAERAHEELRRRSLERMRDDPSLVLISIDTGEIVPVEADSGEPDSQPRVRWPWPFTISRS